MSSTLYVSRVSEADLSALEDLFSTVGDVQSCRVEAIPESGQQTDFGIFEMASAQQSSDCVERFNGYAYSEGRSLGVVSNRPVARAIPKNKGKRTNGKR